MWEIWDEEGEASRQRNPAPYFNVYGALLWLAFSRLSPLHFAL